MQGFSVVPVAQGFEYAADEAALRARIRGTALEPGLTQRCPAVLKAKHIVQDMRRMCMELAIPAEVWDSTRRELDQLPMWELLCGSDVVCTITLSWLCRIHGCYSEFYLCV